MKATIERCAGIDIGKKLLTACILIGASDAEPTSEKRLFGTFNSELEALRGCLVRRAADASDTTFFHGPFGATLEFLYVSQVNFHYGLTQSEKRLLLSDKS